MKHVLLLCTALIATSAFAFEGGWNGPADMTTGCGNAIWAKLLKDKETGQYITKKMDTSLEWSNKKKTAVSFTTNFDEDVRDGYITGEIEVSVKAGGYCVVGKVLHSSVGD